MSLLLVLLASSYLASAVQINPPDSSSKPSRLWATSPGRYYNDSYLIGNGRFGGGVGGGVQSDVMSMNEDSFWSGGFIDRVNRDAFRYMPELQSLITQGRTVEANRLAVFSYAGTPLSTRMYEALGELEMTMNHSSQASNYERYLDLDDATAGVYYVNGDTAYQREYIASNPDDILAIKVSANRTANVTMQIHLKRGLQDYLNRYEDYSNSITNDTIVMTGHSASATGISFAAGARVLSSGGKVYSIGDTILVDDADEAYIYFSTWSGYRKSDPLAAVKSDLASVKPYAEVRSSHIADYQKYMSRVSLSLGNATDAQREKPTAERIASLNTAADPEMVALHFQFGRYLLISSSRTGTLPPNLQGLWNQDPIPFWGSKYTTNINIQMNYWPALVTNLADLQSPLNDLIESVQERGSAVSKKMYGVDSGFVCHHNTDLWGDSAPQDNYIYSTWWPTAGPWLTFHLMEYYRYTGDDNFLRRYYPTLKSAAEFFVGFLTDFNGYKVTNPSLSPENYYYLPNSTDSVAITLGPTIDNSLLRELFREIKEIQRILNLKTEAGFVRQLERLDKQLPPLRVNYYGGLQEWIEDYKEVSTSEPKSSQRCQALIKL
jgi:alpha-L-fucosidase 2